MTLGFKVTSVMGIIYGLRGFLFLVGVLGDVLAAFVIPCISIKGRHNLNPLGICEFSFIVKNPNRESLI